MQLAPDNQRWLAEFRAKHGRTPRVLHIGNIANNAYNNAKLLNEAGLDCDVICYDYYHIMGCPEWEDADFTGVIKDDFHPSWAEVDLGGFVRPHWFAQGPLELCLQYLIARRSGSYAAKTLWRKMQIQNGSKKPSTLDHLNLKRLDYGWFGRIARQLITSSASDVLLKVSKYVSKRARGNSLLAIVAMTLLFVLIARAVVWPLMVVRHWWRKPDDLVPTGGLSREREIVSNLINGYNREFKDRKDRLVLADIKPYLWRRKSWRKLLDYYDYVIGYSTDPIIPLTVERPYFAFEHGTIREIPYHATAQGRLTALAYRQACHVFVTNFDCIESAEKLAPGRFTIINHPYDEDHGLMVSGSERSREAILRELDCEFLFFHPTRQDWIEGTGYADKSNDVFLRAFASLRKAGARVGLVCCSWGANVAESKALLAEQGCTQHVKWIGPLAITPFERMCLAADIVVDQFKLGAFGGVVFKAMAVGTPILTYLDEQRLLKQYPECPPVVNCRTEEEIILGLQPLIRFPDKLSHLGEASRTWMKKFHAKEGTVNAQVDQFRMFAPIPEVCGASRH